MQSAPTMATTIQGGVGFHNTFLPDVAPGGPCRGPLGGYEGAGDQ